MDEYNKNKPENTETEKTDRENPKTEEISSGDTVASKGSYYTQPPISSAQNENNAAEPQKAEEGPKSSFTFSNASPVGPEESQTPKPTAYNTVNSYTPYGGYRASEPKKKKKGYSFATVMVSVVLAAVIGATSGIIGMLAVQSAQDNNTVSSGQQASGGGGAEVNIDVQNVEATVGEAVAEKVTPSVVGIRTTVSVTSFFGGTQEASGEGSGVIYTSDGYIITNYHVISDAIEYGNKTSEIQVFLSSDTEKGYDATVVGYNISNDLAVIKISGKDLPSVEWADSSALKVGQQVMAIGNPGGLEFMGSATWGIISGLNRVVSSSSDGSTTELIQTDAAINPGNSGGALVNIEGKLVGINSSKLVSESVEGMGFAIPSNTVKDICDKIIAKEYDPDPYLGITISERYDPDTLKRYGYPTGAVIYSVASGSPADEAGLRQGDIITKFNGKEVTHYNLLSQYFSDCKVGDSVSITIYRSGKYLDGKVTIGSNNSQ